MAIAPLMPPQWERKESKVPPASGQSGMVGNGWFAPSVRLDVVFRSIFAHVCSTRSFGYTAPFLLPVATATLAPSQLAALYFSLAASAARPLAVSAARFLAAPAAS